MPILIDYELCDGDGYGECVDGCPVNALDIQGNFVVWSEDDCITAVPA